MASSPRVVAVLGMHRSGTSALAGSLEEAGLALGDVSKQDPYNLKGNQENRRIVRLHEDLLAGSGGSWDAPPVAIGWTAAQRRERDAIIASYSDCPTWGFKDPRTLLTLEGWLEALPDLRCVATFRHPAAVASSLANRDSLSIPFPQGLELWARYAERLIRARAELGFDVISFDQAPEPYLERLRSIARRLGLEPPTTGFRFFEDTLRRRRPEAGDLPPEIARLYGELTELGV